MSRIAFFTPLPPAPTGIADYSAEILPALSASYDIDVFTDDPGGAPPLVRRDCRVVDTEDFSSAEEYDLCLYQIGNHALHHGRILRRALTDPGLAVIHEYGLHDLVRETAMADGGFPAYAKELEYCLGRTGVRLASELRAHGPRIDKWRYPLFERLVDRSLATAVHGRSARRRILASRPRATVYSIPHHVNRHEPEVMTEGTDDPVGAALLEAEPVIGIFGIVASDKRIDLCLQAFAQLRLRRPRAALLVVGAVAPGEEGIERQLAATDGVIRLPRVELGRLLALMASVDLAISLRQPTAGETSGTCMRLLGLGKPVVVSDHGWFSEIPDGCCIKLAPGVGNESDLGPLLVELAAQPELCQRIGRNAQAWVQRAHNLERTIDAYRRAIEATIPADGRGRTLLRPLPTHRHDVGGELIVELSAALGDLGLDEGSDPLAEELARMLVELQPERA